MTRRPTIEWQVCGVCNYDCSYCIQSPRYRVGHPTPAQVEGFLGFFAGLPGRWEVKMTGGEPFAFKGFMERIVPGLVAGTPHTLSVLTNLSAPWPVLERFATLTRGRLGIVSASLHLEHTDAASFADKARRLREVMDPGASLVVNSVLVPGRLAGVQAAREVLAAAGLTLYPQLYKVAGGVHEYDAEDQPRVGELVGISPGPRRANLAPSYRGRLCWSGVEYLVLLQDGEAWSCRTARRHRAGRLGNVLDGSFRLAAAPLPCAWDICPCAVPANRGMIEGVA